MAVKLSSYYWFRNNYLMSSLEDEHYERAFFNGKISPEDRKKLEFIIDELDELKNNSYFQQGKPVMTDHVAMPNIIELIDVTANPELAASCLNGIHRIMEKYWVQVELYRQLGRCFDELAIQTPADVADAVKYALDKIRSDRYSSLGHMCWSTIKDHKSRGI